MLFIMLRRVALIFNHILQPEEPHHQPSKSWFLLKLLVVQTNKLFKITYKGMPIRTPKNKYFYQMGQRPKQKSHICQNRHLRGFFAKKQKHFGFFYFCLLLDFIRNNISFPSESATISPHSLFKEKEKRLKNTPQYITIM